MSDEEQKRLEQFGRFRPPEFSGAESEDVQDFLDRCQWILCTAGILETSGVSFTTFQLLGVAFRWWETRREELHRQFEQLRHKGMSMTQYEMVFSELAHHAIWLVPIEGERIRRFNDGINYGLRFIMTLEIASGARFYDMVDIARWLEQSPPLLMDRSCFKCEEFGHVRRYCPCFLGGPVQQRGQPMTSVSVTSPPAQLARGGTQAARDRPRWGGRSSGGQALCYAFFARPEVVASDAVITCIVSVCHRDASILFKPGSTYSYVSSQFWKAVQ
ncbi:uncharacterized protein [Nicotiana tomentosiformis]|uniref:uncharacterized protein n=1 Tax=Nicotiana tomentosiformis TaxID=4098 RepID=UPI00388CADBE